MKQRGSAMVGILVSAVIIMLLMVVFMYGGLGPNTAKGGTRADGNGITLPGKVRFQALDENCRNNLLQIRSAVMVAKSSGAEDQYPKSLDDMRLSASLLYCSVTPHEPYNYDPATGTVSCPHLGHEKY